MHGCKVRVKVACLHITTFSSTSGPRVLTYSLLFMELFHHVFLHAYHRGLPYASTMAPMKQLNNLSPPVCLATL